MENGIIWCPLSLLTTSTFRAKVGLGIAWDLGFLGPRVWGTVNSSVCGYAREGRSKQQAPLVYFVRGMDKILQQLGPSKCGNHWV